MRMLLAVALALVSGAAWADIPPPRLLPVKKPAKIERPTILVGVLEQGGVERCLSDWKSEWLHLYPMVGFTPLKPAAGVDAAALQGKLVVATGQLDPAGLGPLPAVKSEAECAPMQMRSDWVRSPRGIRLKRSGMGLAGAFVADRVAPFDGLSVAVDGDELVVTLKNTFRDALATPRIHVHYEGCFGKPGTSKRSIGMPELTPGEDLTIRAPLVLVDAEGRPGRRTFRAFSIQVETAPGSVAFDLDWSLADAGVTTTCPDHETE